MKRHLYQSIKAPTKKDFDCLRCEMTGFMRTQVLAVAASLRLAEHPPRTAAVLPRIPQRSKKRCVSKNSVYWRLGIFEGISI